MKTQLIKVLIILLFVAPAVQAGEPHFRDRSEGEQLALLDVAKVAKGPTAAALAIGVINEMMDARGKVGPSNYPYSEEVFNRAIFVLGELQETSAIELLDQIVRFNYPYNSGEHNSAWAGNALAKIAMGLRARCETHLLKPDTQK